jgi:predicted RNase H-like HicB family nuclease
MMIRYSILIQYDGRDNIYVARIPELNGCIAHGNTQEDAVREIQIALELWLETANENGTRIPEPMLFVS